MKKILVIEDEAALREEIVTWLSLEGYEVLEAENGRKGLEIALEAAPDIILSDIMMPELSGKEVLNFLVQKAGFDIPFLFMSALAEREDIRAGMIMGADDYITKPFSRTDLLNSLKTREQKHEMVKQDKGKALSELREQIIMHLPHELRTPLNSIIGFGSMLAEMPENFTPQEIAEFGDYIHKGGLRLHRLVENYLIYIQLMIKKIPHNFKYDGLYIEHLANEVIYNLVVTQKYKQPYYLNFETAPQLHLPEEFLRKIIYELLDNAFKFSIPSSTIKVNGAISGNSYHIRIHNEGRGMLKSEIEKIGAYMQFGRQQFEQQGMGFGLIITSQMLQLAGGSLEIKSDPEKSITVTCIIPFDK